MSLMADLEAIQFWPYFFNYFKINHFVLFLIGSVLAALFVPRFWRPGWKASAALALICLTGVILRISWILFSPHEPRMVWSGDLIENDLINLNALDILKNIWFHGDNGMPYGRRPIGYPLFLALVYWIGNGNIAAVWVANILLFCVTLFFIYRLAKLFFSETQALLPIFFFSIYPVSIYSAKLVTDEHLFLPLLLGAFYFFIVALLQNRPFSRGMWIAIILSSYATLVRTHAIFMPALFFISFLFFHRNFKKSCAVAIIAGAVLFCLNTPWLYRNYQLWKVPVMFTATSCYIYSQVNSTVFPGEGLGEIPGPGDIGYSAELTRVFAEGNEGKSHQLCNQLMKKWILEHPVQFGVTGVRKLLYFMHWNRKAGVWPLWYQLTPNHFDSKRELSEKTKKIFQEMAYVSYYMVFHWWFFAVILLILNYKKLEFKPRVFLFAIFGCFIFWFAEHMIIYSDRKYRFPLEPLMVILGCHSLFWIRDRREKVFKLSANIILHIGRNKLAN